MRFLTAFLIAIYCLAFQPAQASCFCLKCLTLKYRSYRLPSGSMKPTIEPGECFVMELARGNTDVLEPGFLIAFTPRSQKLQFLFRLMAMPGQKIQMVDGVPVIDGVPVKREALSDYEQLMVKEGSSGNMPVCSEPTAYGATCQIMRFRETLPNGRGYEVLDVRFGLGDNTPVFTVPAGHVFVLGDNRDNAQDSRFTRPSGGSGFVSLEEIVAFSKELERL